MALGLGLVAALLADLQDAHGFPTWGLGVIAGASFLTGFVGNVTLGPFADRGRIRLMLVGGVVAAAASLAWLALATQLWEFVASRAVFGIADGAFLVAVRRLVLAWRPDRPGTELGTLMGAGMAGFVAGPIAGGLLAEALGLRAAFLIPALALAATLPFVLRLPYPAIARRKRVRPTLLRQPPVRAALLIAASQFFVLGAVHSIWARMVTDRGASTVQVGLTLTLVVLPVALLAPAAGRLADRFDAARVALLAVVAMTVVAPLYGFVETLRLTVVVGMVHGALSSIAGPASQTLTIRGSPSRQIGAGLGLLEGVGLLAAAIASLPVGWAYGTFGVEWLGIAIAVPAALLALIAHLDLRRVLHPRTAPRDP
jgi:DHA1 family multidrug resistance protein-like MFS transporter